MRLDPWALARVLDIEVTGLSLMAQAAPMAARQFADIDPQAFSAVTVFRGSIREIVYNDAHLPGRQASDVTHELSHGLLLHPAMPALNNLGCRDWDPVLEAEADWLAGVLLITEEAALSIARRGLTDEEAAEAYGVSLRMAKWRMNATAARRRVDRWRQRWQTISRYG